MNTNIKHIAIVRLSALGDIINSAIVLQFLHDNFADIKIDWITEEMFAPILEGHPLINKVHTVNIKKLKKERSFSLLMQTIKELKSFGEYDLIIDIQGLIKSAIVSRLLGKNTHGFDKNSTRESLASLFYKTTSSIPYESNVVKRNSFVVADALGFSLHDNMILNKTPIFPVNQHFELRSDKKNIALVIGASWESKIYPKELMVQVCEELQEQCYIIWGNEKEKQDAEWICEHSSYATLSPKLTLTELVSFISQVDLTIGNDTGPTHIAWAQNIASITLFGPTNSRMMYETPKNIALKSPSKVNLLKINKNDFSIREIKVDTIVTQAKKLLNKEFLNNGI